MRTLWNPTDRAELLRRFASLTDDHAGRWGRMTPAQMVRHIAYALRMATGERPVPLRNSPLKYFPLKQLVLYVFPFPRGAPTAPELVVKDSLRVAEERPALEAAVEAFLARDPAGAWPGHPVFGTMSGEAWGALAWKHADHHLQQFGC